jgi:hypothetical protein
MKNCKSFHDDQDIRASSDEHETDFAALVSKTLI